jgi:hypothetical protein
MTLVWIEEVAVANLAALAAGSFLAYAGVFPNIDYRLVLLGAMGIAFILQMVYDFVIFPYMLSSMKHLPKVKVCFTCLIFIYPCYFPTGLIKFN